MQVNWHFREKRRGDDIADPISGEFFSDGSIDSPAAALVREMLQNAMDAGRRADGGDQPVRVRIRLCKGASSLPVEKATRWFGTLFDHLRARSGLRNPPQPDEPLDFLTIEDFGTSGLTGDIDDDDAETDRNNFVDFLRSDGRTRKASGEGGSWGVGKNVFPRSSRINSFIAYTVRRDDGRALLMGKCILKIRRLQNRQFVPWCYLARSWDDDDVPRPIEATPLASAFRQDFRLEREQEPGLSLVIPWVDHEIEFDDLRRAVVREFFYPILGGKLIVQLGDGRNDLILDATSLRSSTDLECDTELLSLVELGDWSLGIDDAERLETVPPPADRAQTWSSDLIPDGLRSVIAEKLANRDRVAVRVTMHIRPKDQPVPVQTHFDIYLEYHDGDRRLRPAFFREQLAISSVKQAPGVAKIRAIVSIEAGPLADLLRNAEPPNHTDWDQKTGNFKNRYTHGPGAIKFVKNAVKELMTLVRAGDDAPDPNVAIDFFSVSDADDRPGGRRRRGRRRGGDPENPDPPLPPPKPKRFRVDLVENGFVIRSGDPGADPPKHIDVKAAYDVLERSPWKQYEPADFDFGRRSNMIEFAANHDAEIAARKENWMRIRVTGPAFEVYVTGFDVNRDLIVNAYDPKESINADPEVELHAAAEAHS